MAMNLKDIDPAVVSSAADKPKQPPPAPAPKVEIPISTKVVKNMNTEEEGEPKYETDFETNCLVSTVDGKVLAMPRAVATKVPIVGALLADQAADDHTPIPMATSASAAIAIAHWVEHVGSASGKTETVMPEVCVYTDMTSFLLSEWEKDFDTRLLQADTETIPRVINFAEQNGMIGLLDFCVIALSCAIRGKSNHEMMVALNVDGEEMTNEDIEAGKAAYPWITDITQPQEN